jgi:hypothetical protein
VSTAVRSTAVLAAVLAIQVAVTGCDDASPTRGDADTAATGSEGSWQWIRGPARRLRGFQDLVSVAVGDRVVVIAGVDYDQATLKALVIDPASRRASRTAPSRWWWRVGYTAVAAGDEVIAWGGCCGPAGRGSRAPGAIYDVARDQWTPLDPGPLGDRHFHTAVWTGAEMIVWGGRTETRLHADGAAYDPRTGSWRKVAPSPLAPRQYHVAVWTGEEMIVWGGSKPLAAERERLLFDGAAYDPERDAWRRLAPTRLFAGTGSILAAGLEPDLDAEWTGGQMTIWSGDGAAGYDPDRDRWERIPAPPRQIRDVARGQTVWSGDELIVWGGAGGDGRDVQQGAAYDPSTERWRPLPDAPIRGRDRHTAIAIPHGMLVWGGCCRRGYYMNGAIYLRDRPHAR